jgi:hypothetical protein
VQPCFNFKSVDEALFKRLDSITAASIAAMKGGGYITEA